MQRLRALPRRARAVSTLALLILILGGAALLMLQAVTYRPRVIIIELTPTPDDITRNRLEARAYQALFHVEAQAAQSGWTVDLRSTAGELWFELGDLGMASAHWQAAVLLGGRSLALLRELANAYIRLSAWRDAADTLSILLEVAPEDTWARYQLGMIRAPFNPAESEVHLRAAVAEPGFTETASALLTALRDYSTDPMVSLYVGLVFAERELWAHAELAFTHAASVNQLLPEADAYVGLARDRQGKDGSAWVERAIARDPANPTINYLYGLHLRIVGNLERSLTAFLRAAAFDPENPAIQAELGSAYRLLGEFALAETHYQQAVTLSNGDPQFQRLLAAFYAEEAGTLGISGMEQLWASIGAASDDPDLITSYALYLHRTGNSTEGLVQVNRALSITPNHPRALYYKARILLDMGDVAAARGLLEQVIALGGALANDAQTLLDSLATPR